MCLASLKFDRFPNLPLNCHILRVPTSHNLHLLKDLLNILQCLLVQLHNLGILQDPLLGDGSWNRDDLWADRKSVV